MRGKRGWLIRDRVSRRNANRHHSRRLRLEQLEKRRLLAVFLVTSTEDAGPGSLRDALLAANADPGPDSIQFDIPGPGPHAISPLNSLPGITDPVALDGTTQPGYSGKPVIELVGFNAPGDGLQLLAGSDSSSIVGLAVNQFSGAGITVLSNNNTLLGNYIGTDTTGLVAAGNSTGILLDLGASANVIGGTAAGSANVVSGNANTGIVVSDLGTESNAILGNIVGLAADGTTPLGNGGAGIWLTLDASFNRIGGTDAGTGNVISGNAGEGIRITGGNTQGNILEGNRIGTDVSGLLARGNVGSGVLVASGDDNVIGGTEPGAGNVISANAGHGVELVLSSTLGTVIRGNMIGLGGDGVTALGNDQSGIYLEGAGESLIGGDDGADGSVDGLVGARNIISANQRHGIEAVGDGADRAINNVIAGNYIGTDVTGTLARGNLLSGIGFLDRASDNVIGGTTPGAGNVISGNIDSGVLLGSQFVFTNRVEGNRIGVAADGLTDLGNNVGVDVRGAQSNRVGGGAAGAGNVIAGNVTDLIVASSTAIGNRIQGNIISMDASGSTLITPSFGYGIIVANGPVDTVIGTDSDGVDDAGEGNLIGMASTAGILVQSTTSSPTGTVIAGNQIGLSAAGTALGTGSRGIWLLGATDTRIGTNGDGTNDAGERNIIVPTATSSIGILVHGGDDSSTSSTTIAGNYIGIDESGTAGLSGTTTTGISVNSSTTSIDDIRIGGTTGAERNVIGSTGVGIQLTGGSVTDVAVIGNYVGTNATGTSAIGNQTGVLISGSAQGIVIGGANAQSRNLISGNASDGVRISDFGTTGNQVAGNWFGLNALGTAAIGNRVGVRLTDGSSGNLVGGTDEQEGNVISGSIDTGVLVQGDSQGNSVYANRIGTSADGLTAVGNLIGVNVLSDGNQIGSGFLGTGNQISGNTLAGVRLSGDSATNNLVQGNLVGLDAAGTAPLPNGNTGIWAFGSGAGNVIGADGDGFNDSREGNTVSGNAIIGIRASAGALQTLIAGNRVGTEATGTVAIGNSVGVDVEDAPETQLGGEAPFLGNVISGNSNAGVSVKGVASQGTTIQGNYIGTNASGSVALPNGGVGVGIDGGATGVTLGGSTPGAGNVISGNALTGVVILGSGTDENLVLGNRIGVDIAGEIALGNGGYGVAVGGGAAFNVIGGAGAGNVISGNQLQGVRLADAGPDNLVQGNYIGTDATGSIDLGNTLSGVLIFRGAGGNRIGGHLPELRNVISGNGNHGIHLQQTDQTNYVQGNYIGTDASGSSAIANTFFGAVYIDQSDNQVVGTDSDGSNDVGEGNLISGNVSAGLFINSGNSNTVAGNIVGLDATGTAKLANGSEGIVIRHLTLGTSINNVIGGTTPAARNIISGNGQAGIQIDGERAGSNVIQGNYIGTDISGTVPIGNSQTNGTEAGILINNAPDMLIGGTVPGAGNLISGNFGTGGIAIGGPLTTGTQILGNLIGTDVTGTTALGNPGIGGSGSGVIIAGGASNNRVGGLNAAERNVISGNAIDGVRITGSGTDGNVIQGNYIGTNAAGEGLNARVIGWFRGENNLDNEIGGEPATLVNDAGFEPGFIGQGFGFDDSDGGAIVTDLTNDYGEGLTYEFWVRTTDSDGFLIGDAGNNDQVGTAVFLEAGQVVFRGFRGQSESPNFVLTGPLVNDGEFHHVAATWSGSPNSATTLELYVDGQLVASGQASQRIDSAAEFLPTSTVIFGGPAGLLSVPNFGGELDEVTVYGRLLLAQEVAAIYNRGSNPKPGRFNNVRSGVRVEAGATNTLIGGDTSAARNVIGDNESGISIDADATTDVVIQNNYIGTDASGYQLLNTWTGVSRGIVTSGGASQVTIGGAGVGNVISGNTQGIYVSGGSSQFVIEGNLVGLGPDGDTAVSNFGTGVHVSGSSVRVGGAADGQGNVVSANHGNGVRFVGTGVTDNQLIGNLIGTDSTGTKDRGNRILSLNTSGFGTIGVTVQSPTQIGGTNPGEGNVISGTEGIGLWLFGAAATGTSVESNKIGTDVTGTVAIPNSIGIDLFGAATGITIGGTTAAARNIISGNVSDGIREDSIGGNVFVGNFIGTDVTGTAALGNGGYGISTNDAPNMVIGGAEVGAGNLISGNSLGGVFIRRVSAEPSNTIVQGNYIGTDVTGTLPLGNGTEGVYVFEATDVLIGGPNPGEGNVISGNNGSGVHIQASPGRAAGNVVIQGNQIGTDVTGALDLANVVAGIRIRRDASDNTIGGTGDSDGNQIAFNGVGVVVESGSGNTIRRNAIYDNQGLGIDLAADGVTANDLTGGLSPPDDDFGANGLQNYPQLDNAIAGATTRVIGTLESTPDQAFSIDFYASPAADLTSFGEGRRWLGSLDVNSDAAGLLAFDVTLAGLSVTGESVTAVATGPDGSSEFSQAVTAIDTLPPTITDQTLILTEVLGEEGFGQPTQIFAEGSRVRLDGLFDDADTETGHDVVIDWGDDSPNTILFVPSADPGFPDPRGFAAEHTYDDDRPSGTPADTYPITVRASDRDDGASGTASIAVTIQNISPVIVGSLSVDPITTSEGGSATLSGEFTDPGPDRHVVTVDWGDGSPLQSIPLQPGARSFSIPHAFADDASRVSVTIADDDLGSVEETTRVKVGNVAPTASILGPITGFEGQQITFIGIADDPGVLDQFTYSWTILQDGSAIVAGKGSVFAFTPPNQGNYTARLVVRDDDGAAGTASQNIVVENVAPVVPAGSLQLLDGLGQPIAAAREGQPIQLAGTVLDAATDALTLMIDWGDGTPPTGLNLPAGTTQFSAPHRYLDDDPTATPTDTYNITVSASDPDGGSSATVLPIDVTNQAPSVAIVDAGSTNTTVRLRAVAKDPSAADTFTFDWLVDGLSIPATANGMVEFPRPVNSSGTATVTVTDDDGGATTVSAIFIAGTDLVDAINIDPGATPTDVTVTVTTGSATVIQTFPVADVVVVAAIGSNDTITVNALLDVNTYIDAGDGNDTIIASSGDDVLMGGLGDDLLFAGDGNNLLDISDGNDDATGGTGDDIYRIWGFSDKKIQDSSGNDTLDFSGVPNPSTDEADGVTVDLGQDAGQVQQVRSGGTVSLTGTFENVDGTNFKDRVTGNSANNLLFGGGDSDTIDAGDGDDSIGGGEGNDLIFGGASGSDSIDGGDGDDSITGGDGNDLIFGGAGQDTVMSGDGDESISGGDGNDLIFGGDGGNDTVDGGSGDDSIEGGLGNDLIFGGMGNDTVSSGSGDESIDGGEGNDLIFGGIGAGNDTIDGGGGDDSITGGDGNDLIFAGTGDDTISSGGGDESIDGGEGNDLIFGGLGNGLLFGGGGDDTITSGDGDDSIEGGSGNDLIFAGGGGNETVDGGLGDDSITGGEGNDLIFGGGGDDTIMSGDGDESIDGGEGNDLIFGGGGGSETILGGDGDDSIVGGEGNDLIFGGNDNDTIQAGGGDESIDGGSGNDLIFGGPDSSADTIDGGLGDDSIQGGEGNDLIFGGLGDDTLMSGGGDDSIGGGEGNDLIFGGISGTDTIDGGGGDDSIVGGEGNDLIFGGAGNDTIMSGGGDESIDGGDGNDLIFGGIGDGTDTIDGGGGDDSILGGEGNDLIFGGAGNDTIQSGSGDESINGGEGNDLIFAGVSGTDTIDGGGGDDSIVGGEGNDLIFGGSGDDTISSGSGDESIDGGEGNDLIFGGANDGTDSIQGGEGDDSIVGGEGNDLIFAGAGDDTIQSGSGDESISGGDGNDLIFGSLGGNDTIDGGSGDDSIIGGEGNDLIFGGPGDDTLSGGGGDDSIDGGEGNDLIFGQFSGDATLNDSQLVGDGKTTSFSNIEAAKLVGSDSGNRFDASLTNLDVNLIAGGGDDALLGGGGRNLFASGDGSDTLFGGTGPNQYQFIDNDAGDKRIEDNGSIDTIDFSLFGSAISIDLAVTTVQQVGGALSLLLVGEIENVIGSNFDDVIRGNALANRLVGLGGYDELEGREGDDVLEAGMRRIVFLDFDSATESGEHVYTAAERDTIEARIAQDYLAFDVKFTQTQPLDGPFVTVLFNAAVFRPDAPFVLGGASNRIGWSELLIDDFVQVDVNGFFGSESNELPPTSQNFIAMSSTIAAHELGHTYGLRHQDAFGPAGSGVFVGLDNAGRYRPVFSGPALAAETSLHLISSPAAVGTALVDALGNPFFGERESVKLAFAENGRRFPEATNKIVGPVIAGRPGPVLAQQLGELAFLSAPNTVLQGAAAGGALAAAATAVFGTIELDGATSESDFYTFSGSQADVVTIEVYSTAIRHRNGNPIDSVIRVYDSAGNKLAYYAELPTGSAGLGAFNDDQLEPTDSVLLDLILPADDDYTIEVDTFSFDLPEVPLYLSEFDAAGFCLGNPTNDGCTDTDTGGYELLVYRVSGRAAPAVITDTLIGGDGADRLIGNSGKELYEGFNPDEGDVIEDPSGDGIFSSPLPVLTQIDDQTVPEGSTLDFIAGAVDPDSVVLTWTLQAVDGFVFPTDATIDPNTGEFNFQPADDGEFRVRVRVTDPSGQFDTQEFGISATNVAPEITEFSLDEAAGGPAGTAAIEVAFTDAGVADTHTAIVDWGDGTIEPVSLVQLVGGGQLNAEYTYAQDGAYSVTVTITDDDGDMSSQTLLYNTAGDPDPIVELVSGTLRIIGSPDADQITLLRSSRSYRVYADFLVGNQLLQFPTDAVENIFIASGDGDDRVTLSLAILVDTEVNLGAGDDIFIGGRGNDLVRGGPGNDYLAGRLGDDTFWGGDGNDTISGSVGNDLLFGDAGDDLLDGGLGNDIVVGGDGADEIFGGSGTDVLIGGDGADRLEGGFGSDLLIGARTSFDTDVAALLNVNAEWSSARGYQTRIANLRTGNGSTNRENGDRFLLANVTVFDDGASDQLEGAAGQDWFFALLGDQEEDELLDLTVQEQIDELLSNG